jgi:formylglycine-generating enzyme required for sulfatase activity
MTQSRGSVTQARGKHVRQAAVGRADLLRFLADETDPALRAAAAKMLGLPALPASLFMVESTGKQPLIDHEQSKLTTTPHRAPLRCPELLVARLIEGIKDDSPNANGTSGQSVIAPWLKSDADAVEAMLNWPGLPQPPLIPLTSIARRVSTVQRVLKLPGGTEVNMPELLRRVSLARFPWPLPIRQVQQQASRLVVLIDWSAPLRCFAQDFEDIALALAANHGRQHAEIWYLPNGPLGERVPYWQGQYDRKLNSQSVVVVLSDFGAGRDTAAARWVTQLRRLRRQAGRVVAMAPCALHDVPVEARRCVAVVPLMNSLVPGSSSQNDQLNLLIAALSPALTVEPHLLRAMRLALLPNSSPLLERDVWRHADLAGNLPFRQWLPERQRARLEELGQQAPAVLSVVDRVLSEQHAHRQAAQRDEETMLLGSLKFGSAQVTAHADHGPWCERFEHARENCVRVAKHLLFLEGGREGGYAPPLADGSHSAGSSAYGRLLRMPIALRKAEQAGAGHLFAASHTSLLASQHIEVDLPEGVDASVWNALLPGQTSTASTTVEVRQQGQSVWLGAALPSSSLPKTGAVLMWFAVVGNKLEIEINGRRRLVSFSAERLPMQLHSWIGQANPSIKCRWRGGGFEVHGLTRPSWAPDWRQNDDGSRVSFTTPWGKTQEMQWPQEMGTRITTLFDKSELAHAFGADEFGLHMLIDIKGVQQTFRYIEPGTFQMGSLNGDDDERPAHQVTITQGYWLADTPCTQALWMAMMDSDNPSRFNDAEESAERPVENVSWDTVQLFLERLQLLLPEACKATLPSEAEWEYAVRAGTQTEYFWGDEPNTAKANMNRSKTGTTPVKTYEASSWGLFDVHGNIWEWSADAKRLYLNQSEVDPDGGGTVNGRILRGGSWDFSADSARSASRLFAPSGYALKDGWHDFGFRIALRPISPADGAFDLAGRRPASAAGSGRTPTAPQEPHPMFPEADRWRAPVNDFPPRWANAWGDDEYGLWAELAVNGVTQRMRWIEPGEFLMGSSEVERRGIKDKDVRRWAHEREGPQHNVELTKGFWLADTPCTQAFWVATTDKNPSRFHEGDDAGRRPVEQVSWDSAVDFLTKLGNLVPEANAMLLSEAQWEYACRAGTQTSYWWGEEMDNSRANWKGSTGQTSEVKRYKANPWGLFDVHGNVWEWCSDAMRPFSAELRVEPYDGRESHSRVLRGGSWDRSSGRARSAYRRSYSTDETWGDIGFRFALRSPSPGSAPAGP